MSQTPTSNSGSFPPPPPPPGYAPAYYPPPAPPPRRGGGILARIAVGLVTSILLGSLALNLWLGAFFASSMHVGPHESPYQSGDPQHRIVILPVVGAIDDSTPKFVREALDALRKTTAPAALVLRVDSPGGGVGASDRTWHELQQYQDETHVPIVASYGDVAASGGYYVSCGSDYIIAEPTTITGSIGVMFMTFNVEDLMKKIGVGPTVMVAQSSPDKDVANNMFRAFGDKDRAEIQPFLDTTHQLFMQRVFAGRQKVVKGLTMDEVRSAATGRAYSADQALALKLIDAQGYLGDAIDKAAELAGLAKGVKPQVMVIKEQGGLLSSLGASSGMASPTAQWSPGTVRKTLEDMAQPRLEYRWNPQP